MEEPKKPQPNPFSNHLKTITINNTEYKYYSINELDPKVASLPFSIKILLECALRNCDEFNITSNDVKNILNWKET
jgi:aconitate hydratase